MNAEDRRKALVTLAGRVAKRKAILDELHPKQRAVAEDPSQYKALLCGRRSGKTELDARLIALALEECGPDEWVIYAAVTRSLAKDLIWTRLETLNERHQLGWRMIENEGLIETPRGGKFRCLGFDKLPELQKVRGYKLRLAIFDEPATYADKLEGLIRECVGPALSDLRGKLVINGTPGAACIGYWFEASTGKITRYKTYHWTVRNNPKYPRNAEEMLAEERAENHWTEEDAAYRREWLAEWLDDPDALVYAFTRDRNTVTVSGYDRSEWLTTLGVDFGMTDSCAWAVIGSHKRSRQSFVLHAEKHVDLLPSEAAEITKRLRDEWQCSRIVGDGGGLGKPYVEEFNRRHAPIVGIHIELAEKSDKTGAISLLNGDLRAQQLMLCLPEAECLASEIQHLPWASALKKEEHPGYDNHCADAMLYCWRAHRAYYHRTPVSAPEVTSEELDAIERRKRMRGAGKTAKPWHLR